MKLNIGDAVVLKVEEFVIKADVEDSSKGDELQAKVTSIADASGNEIAEPGTLPYRVGKVDTFDRKALVEPA